MARRSVLVLAVALGSLVTSAPSRATVTEYPTCSLPPTADGALCADGRSPNSIVAGPDGAVWFTTYGGGEVGRITIAGAITLFNVPRPAGESSDVIRGPAGITAGPDGSLWYVEDFGNRVGRVATDGTFTTYDVPGARPADIAVGPDSALWFTAAGTNSIGRIATTGSVSSFPLPAPGGASIKKLGGIVRGGDDRLWFAEVQGRKIGAIRTDGTLREYPLPAGVGTPYDLTAGPDGAVWFSLFDSDRIGRITRRGTMRFFHLPAGSGPSGLTFASDGGLWIGASGAQHTQRDPAHATFGRFADADATALRLVGQRHGRGTGPRGLVHGDRAQPDRADHDSGDGRARGHTGEPGAGRDAGADPAAGVRRSRRSGADGWRVAHRARSQRPGSGRSRGRRGSQAPAGHPRTRLGPPVGAGKHAVRLRLTASGRRILAHSRHPKVVVAARARGGDRRLATRERTARLR